MKKEKLPRREREKLKQRQEMLDAALELFSEKGYHNVSMQEIAERAEFALGTLYKFFESKENLYQTLILESSQRFHETLMKAIEEGRDEVEKLENYIKATSALFEDHSPAIRLYFAVTLTMRSNIRADLEEKIRLRRRRFLDILADIFESGMQKKRFRRIAGPHQLAVALISVTTMFLFHWLDDPGNAPCPEDSRVILDIFFQGLLIEQHS